MKILNFYNKQRPNVKKVNIQLTKVDEQAYFCIDCVQNQITRKMERWNENNRILNFTGSYFHVHVMQQCSFASAVRLHYCSTMQKKNTSALCDGNSLYRWLLRRLRDRKFILKEFESSQFLIPYSLGIAKLYESKIIIFCEHKDKMRHCKLICLIFLTRL